MSSPRAGSGGTPRASPTPDLGTGVVSPIGNLPTELIELILDKAAKAGSRRASYLGLMRVNKAFLGPCRRLLHRDIVCTTEQHANGLLDALGNDEHLALVTRKLAISSNGLSPVQSAAYLPANRPTTHLQAHQILTLLPNLKELTIQHADNLACVLDRPQSQLTLLAHVEVLKIVGPGECSWDDLVRILAAATKLRSLTVARLNDDGSAAETVLPPVGVPAVVEQSDDDADDDDDQDDDGDEEESFLPARPTMPASAPPPRPFKRTRRGNSAESAPEGLSWEQVGSDSDVEILDYQPSPSAAASSGSATAGPANAVASTSTSAAAMQVITIETDDEAEVEREMAEGVQAALLNNVRRRIQARQGRVASSQLGRAADVGDVPERSTRRDRRRRSHGPATTSNSSNTAPSPITAPSTRDVDYGEAPAAETDIAVAPELPATLGLRSLTLSAAVISDNHFVTLLELAQSSLTALHLLDCTSITRPGLVRAFRHLGALDELELHGCEFEWGNEAPPIGNPPVPRIARRGAGAGSVQAFDWTGRLVPPAPVAAPVLAARVAGGAGGGGGVGGNAQAQAALAAAQRQAQVQALAQMAGGPPAGNWNTFANGAGLGGQAGNLAIANAAPVPAPPAPVLPLTPLQDQLLHPLDYLPAWCPFLHSLCIASDDLGSARLLRQLARLPLDCLQLGFASPRLDAADLEADLFAGAGTRLESLYVSERMRWTGRMLEEARKACGARGVLFGADEAGLGGGVGGGEM